MKKEIISESRLREIISEEAARFKKKLVLESEKKKIRKRLEEIIKEEKELDENIVQKIGGFFKKQPTNQDNNVNSSTTPLAAGSQSANTYPKPDEEITQSTTPDQLKLFLSGNIKQFNYSGSAKQFLDILTIIIAENLSYIKKIELDAAKKISESFVKSKLSFVENNGVGEIKYSSKTILNYNYEDDGTWSSAKFQDLSALLMGIKDILN